MPDPRPWRRIPRSEIALPDEVSAAFVAYLRERFPKATPTRLADAVEELSDAFTADRARLPGSYLNQPPVRSAYLAYIHPLQVLRARSALQEARARATTRGLLPARETVRIADLGAGLGAMSQAWLLDSADEQHEIALVDHQRSGLADARELVMRVAAATGRAPPRLRTAATRILPWLSRARSEGWRYDVVLLGAVLNEVRDDWLRVFEGILAVTAPDGLVVVVEPAVAETSRKISEVREALLEHTTTIAPCTHGVGCPLLQTRRDWCFTARHAKLPDAVVDHARRMRHQQREVRYAMWAFSPRSDAAPPERAPEMLGRVVSDDLEGVRLVCAAGACDRATSVADAVRGDLTAR